MISFSRHFDDSYIYRQHRFHISYRIYPTYKAMLRALRPKTEPNECAFGLCSILIPKNHKTYPFVGEVYLIEEY